MAIDWRAFCDIVEQHERFVLTSHVRPDADAVGSEVGLAELLEAQGKTVRITRVRARSATRESVANTCRRNPNTVLLQPTCLFASRRVGM